MGATPINYQWTNYKAELFSLIELRRLCDHRYDEPLGKMRPLDSFAQRGAFRPRLAARRDHPRFTDARARRYYRASASRRNQVRNNDEVSLFHKTKHGQIVMISGERCGEDITRAL